MCEYDPDQAAAAHLAIGERTQWSLSDRGEIATVRIARAGRYDPADLASFVARQKTQSTPRLP